MSDIFPYVNLFVIKQDLAPFLFFTSLHTFLLNSLIFCSYQGLWLVAVPEH